MQYIKEKIKEELSKKGLIDLKFLFSNEVLDVSLELLNELLDKEKQEFEETLKIKNENIDFDTFFEDSNLDLFFSILNHFQNVASNDKLREIIETFEPNYVDFGNYISYNKRYYEMLEYALLNCNLNYEEKRILELSIKGYKVRGISLSDELQNQLKEINKKSSDLSLKFGNNLLDSQKEFEYIFENDDTIKSMQEMDLIEAKNKAEKKSKKGYLFDSSPSCYQAIMKYCTDGLVRKHFYDERNKFASNGKFDNRGIVLEKLKLRHKKAKILGFNNYAELSLVFKMADNPEDIIKLIDGISKKALKKGEEEIENLKNYFNKDDINPWDLAYLNRIYKEKEFNFDEKELKKYFEFDKVLNGLFDIANKLYGVEMKQIIVDSYSKDIKFYEVYRNGEFLSYFMGDYFYNPDKRSGAWCDNLRSKREDKITKEVIHPIIINVCAFQKGESGNTLLNYLDVETMFHEFGHALHEILSKSKYGELSGFNVEWDFVELPSQFMENYCKDRDALKLFAKNIETGLEISDEILDNLEKLEKFGNGNFTLRQNEFTILDMNLHIVEPPKTIDELDFLTLSLSNKNSLFKKDKTYKTYTSFSHIFDGGYAAGYYSYIRAEIIEAQVWSIFKKNGIFNKNITTRFFDTILSTGSTKDAKDLFFDFAGEKVSTKALLERKGF